MPEGMMPGQGGPPPGAPPAPAPAPGGQATGNMPATMGTPNRGIEAAAQAKLAIHVQALTAILPNIPAGSDMARDLREAINKLAKHVPPGGVSQGIQMTEAQRQLMQMKQNAPQIAAMRAAQAGGGQGTPPGQPPAQPPAMAA